MTGPAPQTRPRRQWLLAVVGALVAGGIWWSAARRRRAPAAAPALAGVPQLLDFGMDICDQCKKTKALLSRIEPAYSGKLQVRYLDVREEATEALAEKYRMRVIPLLVLLDRNGVEVWRHEGAPSETAVREQVELVVSAAQQRGPAAGASGAP